MPPKTGAFGLLLGRIGRLLDKLCVSTQGCTSGICILPAESVVEDKRVHPRVVVNTLVSYEVKNGAAFTGLVKDISIGGTFVETTEVVPFGTEVTIVARFASTKGDLRLPGTVRWTKPDGFGVQFGALGARETHAISQLLKR